MSLLGVSARRFVTRLGRSGGSVAGPGLRFSRSRGFGPAIRVPVVSRFAIRRAFSTSPPKPPPSSEDDASSTTDGSSSSSTILGKIMTPQNQSYAVIAGGTFGTLVFAKGMMSFTNFFTSLSPAVVAKYGFYLGFGTCTCMSLLAAYTLDTLTVRADPVYKHALAKVQASAAVEQRLGDGVLPGSLRSYRLDAGKFEATSSTSVKWRNPRIQMIFDVRGTGPPFRTGVVTCEAVKVTGSFPPKLRTNVLKVDYETGDEGEGGEVEGDSRIWLRGDEDKFNRVSARSGLALSSLAEQVRVGFFSLSLFLSLSLSLSLAYGTAFV